MKKTLLLIPFCLTIVAAAKTYYVSTSGNNSNNGLTPANAFLTLQYASNKVVAGDSVVVLAGAYSGFYHTTSGTELLPIVFSAQPGVLINAPNGTTADGINLEGANYIIIEGFHVFGVPRAGIRCVTDTGVIIRNNRADSCGKWGILTGFSENITIENNECSRSVVEHGIYHSNSADNPVIRGNRCWGNNANGIHINADVSLGGDGIISNTLIENNIIYNNGKAGGSGINCDGVQNSVIQNNLLFDCHASGISLYHIDAAEGAKNNIVVNNTILQASDGRWALNIMDGSTGNIAFNNIFYSAHSFRGSISIDTASMTGFKSNFNIVVDRMSINGGNTVMTLAQWKQATSLDSNSVTSVPASLFVNQVGSDFHLLSNSPAKDFGRMLYHSAQAPLSDLDHTLRPQGTYPDAGCYEYLLNTDISDAARPTALPLNPDDEIYLFDISGKLVFNGRKKFFDEKKNTFVQGMYLYKSFGTNSTGSKSGWIYIE